MSIGYSEAGISTVSYCRILNKHIMFRTIKSLEIIVVYYLILATTGTKGQVHEQYIGCFVDNIKDKQLKPVLKNRSDLTIEICIQKCYNETNRIQSETTFAALANGRACICRNNSGQELRDRNCNVKCSGDQVQNCGGNTKSRFYSLYSVCRIGYFARNCDQLCHCKRHLPCDRETGICPDGCEEQFTGTSCNISNIQKQYIGCYGDGNTTTQAMDVKNPSGETGYARQTTNSIEFCIQICSTGRYTYAGMQYGYDCFCGEKYARYGNKTFLDKPVNCNFTCPANISQKCGGDFASSVYYVCPVGFYGRDCINRCHCSDGGPCRFNGSCLTSTLSGCKPGWMGSACNVRDCSINNGDCGFDEMCESVDLGFANSSMCLCKDGSFRDNNACQLTHLRYIGCYEGNTTQYVSVDLPTEDTLTIEFCIHRCSQLHKKFSIIQGGIACLCGDDYGWNLPDDECRVSCAGNKLQYCGGNNTVDGTPIYVVYTAWIRKGILKQYIGCYKDVHTAHTCTSAMERKFSWDGAGNNTIESCAKHCTSLDYTYAGLQYSHVCFCGNSYDKYGSLPESRCNMPCSGNSSQICGGDFANNVYAVNYQAYSCLTDTYCERYETCNVINLNYMNVSRCRCQHGFHRISTWGSCTDVDECTSGVSACNETSEDCINNFGSYICKCKDGFVNTSEKCEDVDECKSNILSCNTASDNCVNTIGSYRCECKDGFRNVSGQCEEPKNTPAIGIIVCSLLAISLLINALFAVSKIKRVKSRNPGPGKEMAQSDLQPNPAPVGQSNIYEQMVPENLRFKQIPNSEYAELKLDDVGIESSI